MQGLLSERQISFSIPEEKESHEEEKNVTRENRRRERAGEGDRKEGAKFKRAFGEAELFEVMIVQKCSKG